MKTILNSAAAAEARDQSMSAADSAADERWKSEADDAIEYIAVRRRWLTSDDLWKLIDKPREPRALGPAFMRAARRGIIQATDEYMKTAQVSRHAAPIRLWRSLVFVGDRK